MELLNFLSEKQAIITIISTIVLSFATLGLMFYTLMLYIETRRARKIQDSPDISVTIENFLSSLCLFIHNQGKASAYNIKISATPNIKVINQENEILINDFSLMELSYLRVNQWYITDIGTYTQIGENNPSQKVKFNIAFCNEKGAKYKKEIDINIAQFKNCLYSKQVSMPGKAVVAYTSSLPVDKSFMIPVASAPLAPPLLPNR